MARSTPMVWRWSRRSSVPGELRPPTSHPAGRRPHHGAAGWRERLAELHAKGTEVRTIPYEPARKEVGAARRAEQPDIRQRDAARVRARQSAQAEASQERIMALILQDGMKGEAA